MSLRELATNWYAFLSTFNAALATPLRDLADAVNLPLLNALIFGLTIPLALSSPVGVLYPGLFALGTSLPLLALVGLLMIGGGLTKGFVQGVGRLERWMRLLAGLVLVLAGLNDTLVYWFL